MSQAEAPTLSVIVPVAERYEEPKALFLRYKAAVERIAARYEFIYVLDGDNPPVADLLRALQQGGERIRIITLNRWFGEATALALGFEEAKAERILTLPAYEQVEPEGIVQVVQALSGSDLAIARRRRADSPLNRLQSRVFHGMVKAAAGFAFQDLGCGVRALKRQVVEDVAIYGDLHRFLPMLAHRQGFKVTEIEVEQSGRDRRLRLYRPGVYVRRLLDIVTIAFLLRFIRKPFRFFGLVGLSVFMAGLLATAWLVVERLLFGVPLGNRPALIISSLVLVLGVQIFAIGLIAEVIIFTQARKLKEYRVERVVAFAAAGEPGARPDTAPGAASLRAST